jgi:transposase-like protein
MTTNTTAPSYKGFRFPQEIITHAVWLYFRFNLSFRDIEELLAERGVLVTYETVRQWGSFDEKEIKVRYALGVGRNDLKPPRSTRLFCRQL